MQFFFEYLRPIALFIMIIVYCFSIYCLWWSTSCSREVCGDLNMNLHWLTYRVEVEGLSI